MIRSKKELKFYIMSDRIINGLPPKESFLRRVKNYILAVPPIVDYLRYMRCFAYYKNQRGIIATIKTIYYRFRYNRLGVKLGFYINEDVFDYGLCVPHYGTFRIGGNNKIGRYAVIHTVTNITASNCVIGDGLYLSVGAKVIGPLSLGDNVSIAANSVVNKSQGSNILLAGAPAIVKKESYPAWYNRDGETFSRRIEVIEDLKQKMGLSDLK